MERGFFLSSSGRVVAYQNQRPDQIQGNKSASSEQSQETINAEARDAIKDLFPNIPTKDLNQIVKTAFKKVRQPSRLRSLLTVMFRENVELGQQPSFR